MSDEEVTKEKKKKLNAARLAGYQDRDDGSKLWDRNDTERFYLLDAEMVEFHLVNDTVVKGRLVEMGMYVFVIESDKGAKVIIPKHAIAFEIIKTRREAQ